MSTPITTHVADAQARSLAQLAGKAHWLAFVQGFAARWQTVENVLFDLKEDRWLETIAVQALPATNALFDLLGTIVGLDREVAQSDADYKTRLKAKLLVNRSKATADELLVIAQILADAFDAGESVEIAELFPAAFVLMVLTTAPLTAAQLATIHAWIDAARGGGIDVAFVAAFGTPFGYLGHPFAHAYGSGTYATIF